MKSIVVYKITILTGFLLLGTGLLAQKPAIDLISSNHQYRHPESIIDTSYTLNPPVRDAVLKTIPPAQEQEKISKKGRKKRRQIGPSLDSLFHNGESKDHTRDKNQAKESFFKKRLNPVKFIIFITAIK